MSSAQFPLHSVAPEEEANVRKIGTGFAVSGEITEVQRLEVGLINQTYVLTTIDSEGQKTRYVLQRINETVFTDPAGVMKNIELVTTHINESVLRKREDLGGHTLSLFPTRDGNLYAEGEGNGIWRCYNFLEGCQTYDVVENTRQAFEAGRAFGAFQDLVSDLSPSDLIETIPDFHHTRKRFEVLKVALENDVAGRAAGVGPEWAYVQENEAWVDRLLDLQKSGELPIRVTHNDTKINNVMFDSVTDQAVCVIDLDTVMPGLSLYDFGDLVRTATNPATDGDGNVEEVTMREEIFEALVKGYLGSVGGSLTEGEIENLAFSGKLIAFELGMRFLTDYLEGDRYFRTDREGQNLDRARCQFRLAQCIAEKEAEMEETVKSVVAGLSG